MKPKSFKFAPYLRFKKIKSITMSSSYALFFDLHFILPILIKNYFVTLIENHRMRDS